MKIYVFVIFLQLSYISSCRIVYMENSAKILADRFREVILNGTWIANTNYKNELEGLSWEIAGIKHGSLNSIYLLSRHIHYYIDGINNVFRGGSLEIRDMYSFDFPELRSQAEWVSFLTVFWADADEFSQHIEAMQIEKLQGVFGNPKYGIVHRNVDGMIEHAYYHLGQIVLLKKLLLNSK